MEPPVDISSGSDINTAVTIIQTMPTTSVVVEATLSGQLWTRTILHTQSEIALETTVLPLSIDHTLLTPTVPDTSQTALTYSTAQTNGPFITKDKVQSPKAPIGAIVGGLIGGVILLTIIIVFCLFGRNRRRRKLRMRQIPPPLQAGESTYPTAFPINHNSVHPEISKTASNTTPRPRNPLALVNPDETAHRNRIASSVLPTKRLRQGPGNAPHGQLSDEKARFGDQANTINDSEITSDISEEVRLLRVLVRAMEDRHWLSALVGNEITPDNAAVHPPPGYEETNGLLDNVNR